MRPPEAGLAPSTSHFPPQGHLFPAALHSANISTLGPLLAPQPLPLQTPAPQSSRGALTVAAHTASVLPSGLTCTLNSLQPWRLPALHCGGPRHRAGFPDTPLSLPGAPSHLPPASGTPLTPVWSRLHHLYANDTQPRGPHVTPGLQASLSHLTPTGFLDSPKLCFQPPLNHLFLMTSPPTGHSKEDSRSLDSS